MLRPGGASVARLTEDLAKVWLREAGVPVPAGRSATTLEEVAAVARSIGGPVVVKALIPTGRRGKAGAVLKADDPAAAARMGAKLLGSTILGHSVQRIFVEQAVSISRELYLSFTFTADGVRVLACREGGVEIEEIHRNHPELLVYHSVDHGVGLRPYHCVDLWARAGIRGMLLPKLAHLTQQLWNVFRKLDGTMLELNPIVVDEYGDLWVVGAMLSVDDAARFRHPEFAQIPPDVGGGWREPTERELAVAAANLKWPGGAVRYTELDGDIGLFLAGGGAGLLIHDLVLAYGGRPANHTDISPGRFPEKLQVVFDAILTNPRVRSLLVCVNYLQMVRANVVLEALVRSLVANRLDPRYFPVVVRVFGPGEENARAIAARVSGIRYLPRGTSIEEAVRLIVLLTSGQKEGAAR